MHGNIDEVPKLYIKYSRMPMFSQIVAFIGSTDGYNPAIEKLCFS